MEVQMLPLVGKLSSELVREATGREISDAFFPVDFYQAAGALVRYRLPSIQIVRQTDRGGRRMFLSDLRDMARKAFP